MSGNNRKSLVGGDSPTIYVPQFLRSLVRIKIFWYQKSWNIIKVLFRFVFRIKPKQAAPALTTEGGAE